jgi:hypothetical protein
VDARTRGTLGAAEPRSDLAVLELFDDSELDGLPLGLGHLLECRRQQRLAVGDVDELFDPSGRLLVERRNGNAEPSQRSPIDGPAPEEVCELLPRNAVQPGAARTTGVPEAMAPLVRNCKRLGEQIGCDLRIADADVEIRQQPLRPPVVEEPERSRILTRGQYQPRVFHMDPESRALSPVYAASGGRRYSRHGRAVHKVGRTGNETGLCRQ